MQGQLNHFNRYAPETIPYAQTRYLNEVKVRTEKDAHRADTHTANSR